MFCLQKGVAKISIVKKNNLILPFNKRKNELRNFVYKRLLEVVNNVERNDVKVVNPCIICLTSNEWSKSTKENRNDKLSAAPKHEL